MIPFHEIGRLPATSDNVAIATRRLEAGLEIALGERRFTLTHTILEGHRFAIQYIAAGDYLYSWEMPFGTATKFIAPGDYVCNPSTLEALRGRSIDFTLPASSNFADKIPPFKLDEADFRPATQVTGEQLQAAFEGFDRGAARGSGTRNYIIVMATSSRASGFARRLAQISKPLAAAHSNVDGIVAIAHTEGDDIHQLNKTLVLRTLAGFMMHPNVGAALVVGSEDASVSNKDLHSFLAAEGYPINDLAHAFLALEGDVAARLSEGRAQIADWMERVNRYERTPQPMSRLKIALQCGGSDAFSGISGNPLAGWVAREVVRGGGAANLAETDELVGAESYVLKKVRNLETARKFLATIARFKELAERHGSSAEGNPSGGNKYRGLYNIYLKSLGAAMKRDPEVRLDYVIDYGELMQEPGYYFMDSPGNDLESIAGQVASGCNVIYFVTGNGSITNFPFVPTIKIVTTTRRYELLREDMDVNAGAYQEGVPMDELGKALLQQTLDVASGHLSAGEKAGHAQVQLWRNWKIDEGQRTATEETVTDGLPLQIDQDLSPVPISVKMKQTLSGHSAGPVGLIMPTSLCSGQIATMAAENLNASNLPKKLGITRFVSLVHTEGCGASSGPSEDLFIRTMLGYLKHPDVATALLLEHGCEKTHNDYFRNHLEEVGLNAEQFGWASIQQDGGIEPVLNKIEDWFRNDAVCTAGGEVIVSKKLKIGLIMEDEMSAAAMEVIAQLTRWIVTAGGTVVMPIGEGGTALLHELSVSDVQWPTLRYGEICRHPGFHLMAVPSSHLLESVTGLGATGVQTMVVASNAFQLTGHPFIPVLQASDREDVDADVVLNGAAAQQLLVIMQDVLSGGYVPKSRQLGIESFQMSRGWSGVSL